MTNTNNTMANTHQLGVNALSIQGKKDAPRTFKGAYNKVNKFFKTINKLYAHYQVTSDQNKFKAVLPYCSTNSPRLYLDLCSI